MLVHFLHVSDQRVFPHQPSRDMCSGFNWPDATMDCAQPGNKVLGCTYREVYSNWGTWTRCHLTSIQLVADNRLLEPFPHRAYCLGHNYTGL